MDVKEHTLWSIIEGWAVWCLFRGALLVGLPALIWNVIVFYRKGPAADFLEDVLVDTAKKGVLGGALLAALGACIGGVFAFFLFGGDERRDLHRRYTRWYRCKICGYSGRMESTFEWGDANCPRCNTLLSPRD